VVRARQTNFTMLALPLLGLRLPGLRNRELQKLSFRILAPASRQPLVKGERLVRNVTSAATVNISHFAHFKFLTFAMQRCRWQHFDRRTLISRLALSHRSHFGSRYVEGSKRLADLLLWFLSAARATMHLFKLRNSSVTSRPVITVAILAQGT
jgi:hypothetical protein